MTPASTPSNGTAPSDFPELIIALVRLLARQAARAEFAALGTVPVAGGAK